MMEATRDSLHNKQDRQVRVQEIATRAGGSRPTVIDVEGGGAEPSSDRPLSTSATTSTTIVDSVSIVYKTHDDINRTQAEGPRADDV